MSSTASRPRPLPFEAFAAAAYAAAAGAAWALSRGWVRMSSLESVPLCLLRGWTGLPCPGCGMGHAVLEAFQGHWQASLACHALGLPLLAVWTAWLAWGGLNLLRGRPFAAGMPAVGARAGAALAACALVFHGARLAQGL